jgi:hypothetical protein
LFSDGAKREHLMHVKLAEDYPQTAPTVLVDLPLAFNTDLHTLAGHSTAARPASSVSSSPLLVAFERFVALVSACQTFFDIADDLQQHSWILEPEQPIPRAAKHRRIAIGQTVKKQPVCQSFGLQLTCTVSVSSVTENACWLELTIDPLRPTAIPELRLLGNELAVAPLQSRMDERLHEWDVTDPNSSSASSSLRRNLLHVLQLAALPLPTAVNREEFRLECCICLTYKLEGVSQTNTALSPATVLAAYALSF